MTIASSGEAKLNFRALVRRGEVGCILNENKEVCT